MPTLTQAASQADVVKFQIEPNYTNEAITLLLGTSYKSGSVLGPAAFHNRNFLRSRP